MVQIECGLDAHGEKRNSIRYLAPDIGIWDDTRNWHGVWWHSGHWQENPHRRWSMKSCGEKNTKHQASKG